MKHTYIIAIAALSLVFASSAGAQQVIDRSITYPQPTPVYPGLPAPSVTGGGDGNSSNISLAVVYSYPQRASAGSTYGDPASAARAATYGSASKAEIDAGVMSAVEGVLARFGNPPYAEVITNDPVKAQELHMRLNAVKDADKLRAEIQQLTKQRDTLRAENQRTQDELTQNRTEIMRLYRNIDAAINKLNEAQRGLGGNSYSQNANTQTQNAVGAAPYGDAGAQVAPAATVQPARGGSKTARLGGNIQIQ
jgi:peptidoglycan hydrolase CwlO-like protein